MQKDTILYVLTKSQEYLSKKGVSNPRLDAEVLLADILSFTRVKLYTHFDMLLNEDEKDLYRKMVKQRGEYKPVAYIIGKKSFYKHEFFVDESVLIPRPETEELVEIVLKDTDETQELSFLDLCCGSGCIGISIKKERPNISITLSDISAEALNTAKKNAVEILKEGSNKVRWLESDLFSSFSENEQFDRIISNPPYIPATEKSSIMKDVLDFEPSIALFVDNMEVFYRRFFKESVAHIKPGGKLFLETHSDWAEKLLGYGLEAGFIDGQILKDYSNKNRFLVLNQKK